MPLIESNKPYFMPLAGEPHRTQLVNALFTYNVPKQCNCVAVQATVQNIRYTTNGTNPTAASGFQMVAGNPPILIEITQTTVLKFIAETAGAILQLEAGA